MTDAQLVAVGPESPGAAVATHGAANLGRTCERCGRPLSGKQTRFCSGDCRGKTWDEAHPRINRPVGIAGVQDDARSIKDRIRELMADGLQRTTAQIAFDLRVSEATAAREMRKLRARGVAIQTAALRGPSKPAVYYIAGTQPAGQV